MMETHQNIGPEAGPSGRGSSRRLPPANVATEWNWQMADSSNVINIVPLKQIARYDNIFVQKKQF